MRRKLVLRFCLQAIPFIILSAFPIRAQAPSLAMLQTLKAGAWEVRNRGDGARQRLCMRTGYEFVQLQHRQPACKRFVVQNDTSEITVEYTCNANGYGRTTIRRETEGLVQINSQGILNGTPFNFTAEARFVGRC